MEKYRQSTTFPDEVFIEVHVEEFKGVRMKLRYRMERAGQKTVCEAWSWTGKENLSDWINDTRSSIRS